MCSTLSKPTLPESSISSIPPGEQRNHRSDSLGCIRQVSTPSSGSSSRAADGRFTGKGTVHGRLSQTLQETSTMPIKNSKILKTFRLLPPLSSVPGPLSTYMTELQHSIPISDTNRGSRPPVLASSYAMKDKRPAVVSRPAASAGCRSSVSSTAGSSGVVPSSKPPAPSTPNGR